MISSVSMASEKKDIQILPTNVGTDGTRKTSQDANTDPECGFTNPLQVFQTIVGITTPDSITKLSHSTSQPSPKPSSKPPENSLDKGIDRGYLNPGIYQRVCKMEKRRLWEYRACASFINACYIAQIGGAAILTALGASESPHNVITVFGAISTAIAGVLALLKGQGLPTRLRQDWVGLRKVRDYIEDRERMLGWNFHLSNEDEIDKDIKETLQTEISKVLEMYRQQMTTMENNMPDVYVGH
jgi:hypothetical protein